jgi:hypothetical protein
MRKENRSQGSGGKQGEINLTFGNRQFLTRLASCGQYSSDTTCHTPVPRIEPKSPYVCPGCSNHTYNEQYDKQIQYLDNYRVKSYKMTRGSKRKIIE